MEQKCNTVTFRIFPEAEIGFAQKWQKHPHRLRHRFNDRSGVLLLFWCRLWSVLSGFSMKDGEFGVRFRKKVCLERLKSGKVLHLHRKYTRTFYTRTMLNYHQNMVREKPSLRL
jgi:hypothetical protein